jgi:hypothetical protein
VGCPSLRVMDIPLQWDARDAKRCFSIRAQNHQRWAIHDRGGLQGSGRLVRGCVVLMIACLYKDLFLTSEEDSSICRSA